MPRRQATTRGCSSIAGFSGGSNSLAGNQQNSRRRRLAEAVNAAHRRIIKAGKLKPDLALPAANARLKTSGKSLAKRRKPRTAPASAANAKAGQTAYHRRRGIENAAAERTAGGENIGAAAGSDGSETSRKSTHLIGNRGQA